jgi:DNA-directed RNA polymerase subunit M/transcription elongation factor TFIIS
LGALPVYDSDAMDTHDPAGEYLRISERYGQMSDEELLVLAPQSSELTPMAQQALASEVRSRGLKIEVQNAGPSRPSQFRRPQFRPPPAAIEPASSTVDSDGSDSLVASPYDEERKLVDLCTVWSVRDALKVQNILDAAGIPFFMGPDKAAGVDLVTSNFADGIVVQIMKIGMPWAAPGMVHYRAEDEPPHEVEGEQGELVVRCPKCNSEEVVFEGGTDTLIVGRDDSSQKYRWSCDSCGHQWEDEGIAGET